jgi:predicted aldo/keto reductase-like oxidoreductase
VAHLRRGLAARPRRARSRARALRLGITHYQTSAFRAAERGIAVIVNRPFEGGELMHRVRQKPLPQWAAELECQSSVCAN